MPDIDLSSQVFKTLILFFCRPTMYPDRSRYTASANSFQYRTKYSYVYVYVEKHEVSKVICPVDGLVFILHLQTGVAIGTEEQTANVVIISARLCVWQMTTIASLRV